jgi:hypothetical protein
MSNKGKVLRSTNNGDSDWSVSIAGTGGLPYINALASNGAGAVFCIDRGTKKIHKSTDHGATWDAGTVLGGQDSYCITCYGSYVWVGTGLGYNYVSTNTGASYTAIPPADIPSTCFLFHYVGNGLLFAATYGSDSIARIHKSANYGASGSWSVASAFGSTTIVDIHAINESICFVVADSRIYRSINGGASFDAGTELYINTETLKMWPRHMIYHPSSGVVYISTSALAEKYWDGIENSWRTIEAAKIYQSTDNGVTWSLLQQLQSTTQINGACLDGNGLPLFCCYAEVDFSGSSGGRLIGKNMTAPLLIAPTAFVASSGRLSTSSRRYIHKVPSGGTHLHPVGQTLFLTNYGFRYNLGSTSWNVACSLSDTAAFNRMLGGAA